MLVSTLALMGARVACIWDSFRYLLKKSLLYYYITSNNKNTRVDYE